MTSFEDLALGPETVASLAAEGIETPTPFQAAAIPLIARGNDLLGRAGPGSGTLVGYGAPLLDRLEGGAGAPVCLVLSTGTQQATHLARSLAPLCEGSGMRAAALAPHWNLSERADFLFVPADRIGTLYDGTVKVSGIKAVVLHDGDGVVSSVPTDRLETFLGALPSDCQRIFCGLPFGDPLRSVARRFTRRAVTIPTGAAAKAATGRSAEADRPAARGRTAPPRELNFTLVDEDRSQAVLVLTATLLEDVASVRHVLLYTASADQAADLGDFLAVHGYHSGSPGDPAAPVWLSPGEDEAARKALDALDDSSVVATLSCQVPDGAPAARLRHGAGGPAWALAAVRELGHLREVSAAAELKLKRVRPDRPPRVSSRVDQLTDRIHEAVRAPEATPYYLLVESLLDRFTAAEVAAAALLLLDRDTPGKGSAARAGGRPGAHAAEQGVPEPWSRLFMSAGQRDEIGPGELLGAITSESGIKGSRVGRIDVRESHSLVEVRESDAAKVIKALNGTTVGGRALRVDYDRAPDRRSRGKPGQGPPKPPFRPGASGTSGRGKRPPRRPGRS
ncbi:MAG: DbpA RNA binding domain-containing protein [Gemmatimonadetes bacterium]|nr:DbpA RNA binding domain-containing protein [Gemmatimonadota bacterium]